MNITVLTATYNRKKCLYSLYESLNNQICKDFVWLIIDDGSTDGTEDTVSEFIRTAKFKIEYRKKENGGKHTALNYAYRFITTPLTFIVDSDDSLTTDAIDVIEKVFSDHKIEKDLCGFSFLKGKKNGEILSKSRVPENGMKESFVDCRINRGNSGDMAEVWYTDCLRQFPFPEFEDEKFLGEDLVWIRMSGKYKIRFYNNIIYIADYLGDGLTKNRRRHNIRSPKGCMMRAEAFLHSDSCAKAKIKAGLQYTIYGKFAEYKLYELIKLSKYNIYVTLWSPFAMILYFVWKNKYLK